MMNPEKIEIPGDLFIRQAPATTTTDCVDVEEDDDQYRQWCQVLK